MLYEVGKIYEEAIGKQDGVLFDISDSGSLIIGYLNRPTVEEKESFSAGSSFEARFVHLQSVLMMTFKFGSLNWMDAPYTPHLSKGLTTFQIPAENQGLATTILLFDTATGRLENMRLLSFSEQFTRKLFGEVMEMKMQPFDKMKYAQDVNSIYAKYSTRELLKLTTQRFKA